MDWVCIHKMVHTHRKGSMIYYYILEIHLQDPHQISPTKNSTLMSDRIRIKKNQEQDIQQIVLYPFFLGHLFQYIWKRSKSTMHHAACTHTQAVIRILETE